MRYMMIVKADKNYEMGTPPDPKMMEAVGKHSAEMMKAGILLEVGGLLPSFAGARLKVAAGKITVTDGPFSEAKELIGGFAIMKANSKAEAVELGKSFMKLHVDVLGASYSGEMEIRQMFDGADCGAAERAAV